MVCKDKKDDELKKWKWQFPLVWLPWLFALADSLIFVVGLGFYAVNQSWFCGSFVLVNSSNAWRNLMLVVVAGLINIVIISTMVALVKVRIAFFYCCTQTDDLCVYLFEIG